MLKIAPAHRLQASLPANFAAGGGGFLNPSRSPPRYLGGYERLRELRAGALRFLLFGDIDHAAAALPDLLEQLVAPERLTHRFVGCVGEVELDRGSGRFDLCGQQRFRLLVRNEQGVETLVQRRVAFAHGVQECGALLRWFCQRQHKQGFFARWVHGRLLSAFSFAADLLPMSSSTAAVMDVTQALSVGSGTGAKVAE